MHGLGGMVVKAVLRQRLMQRPGKRVLCLTAGKGGGIYRFYGAACLHDHFADRIVVMQAGRTVETVDAATFASGQAQHPFTLALHQALPQNRFHAHTAEAVHEGAHHA